nr:hypothetical protein [Phenylobacterium sp.]
MLRLSDEAPLTVIFDRPKKPEKEEQVAAFDTLVFEMALGR